MPQFNQLQIYQGNVIWERGQVLAASVAEAAIDSITEKAATKKVTIILEDDETPKASFILDS